MKRCWVPCVLSVTVALLTACDDPGDTAKDGVLTTAPSNYQIPDSIRYSYDWAAPVGISLTSPPAVVSRAFIESMDITSRTNMRSGYPGYAQLVANLPQLDFDKYGGEILDLEGTYYSSIVRLSQDERGVWHTGVCMWASATAFKEGDQYSNKLGTAMLYPQPVSFDLKPPADGTGNAKGPASGPARAPSSNVFSGWSVENFELVSAVDRKTCDDLTPTRLPAQYQSHEPQRFDQPPPTLPPTPGWPAAS